MNFRKNNRDEPEINLIPFIDVLLVVLIFLMLSTTYSKFTELQIKLPLADAEKQRDYPKEVAPNNSGKLQCRGVAALYRSASAISRGAFLPRTAL